MQSQVSLRNLNLEGLLSKTGLYTTRACKMMCPSGQSQQHRGMAKSRVYALLEMSVLYLLSICPVHAHLCDELPALRVEGPTSLHVHGRSPVLQFCKWVRPGVTTMAFQLSRSVPHPLCLQELWPALGDIWGSVSPPPMRSPPGATLPQCSLRGGGCVLLNIQKSQYVPCKRGDID